MKNVFRTGVVRRDLVQQCGSIQINLIQIIQIIIEAQALHTVTVLMVMPTTQLRKTPKLTRLKNILDICCKTHYFSSKDDKRELLWSSLYIQQTIFPDFVFVCISIYVLDLVPTQHKS